MSLVGAARLAPVPLRLATGAILTYHGYRALHGGDPDGFLRTAQSLDLPNIEVLSHVASWGALIGGGLLIIGLLARPAALINLATMLVAIWKVLLKNDVAANWKDLPSYQLPLMILVACWAIVLTGAGTLSIDGFFASRRASSAPKA